MPVRKSGPAQLSKPEATAARNQNSLCDRMEKKNLGRNQAQSGGQFSSGQDIIVYLLFYLLF